MVEKIKSKSYSEPCHLRLGDRFCSSVPAYRLLYFDSLIGRYRFADNRRFTLDMARFLLVDSQTVYSKMSFILQPCYV